MRVAQWFSKEEARRMEGAKKRGSGQYFHRNCLWEDN